MIRVTGLAVAAILVLSPISAKQHPQSSAESPKPAMLGFLDPARQAEIDGRFLAGPDPKLAEEHLRILTAAPHVAGTPEDRKTAEYVAQKFREAGLETEIVEYKVWLPYPTEVRVEIQTSCEPDARAQSGAQAVPCSLPAPSREHVEEEEAYQSDSRVIVPFNAYSPAGEVEAEVVYANFGRPEDFDTMAQMGVDVRGKIVLARYGETYRGVKPYVAQQRGAAGVILYSDPQQDGYFQGDTYPKGPWRPSLGVQRGSVGYMFEFPGDPTTPGVASLPSLPDSKRISPVRSAGQPQVLTTALSAADATPVLQNLGGPESPRAWQGALPFTYHLGPGPVRVRMQLKNDGAYRTIWDVVGTIRGRELPEERVVAGNHRDAWVYGAVDPNSGTAAMLEAVHGIGGLLKSGWKPRRTIVFCSWDGEEWGLIGSVEWVEQHEAELAGAVAYLNMDAAVSGPRFGASAVPALKEFVRDVTKSVPAADGKGSVYEAWQRALATPSRLGSAVPSEAQRLPFVRVKEDVPVGDLGSGSDYTPFLQHAGVPSTDIASSGPYGVYHSVFDNFAWFKRFGDPDFRLEQQMARVFGLEVLHMAEADILPYQYDDYGKEITAYLLLVQKRAEAAFGPRTPSFVAAVNASRRFTEAGAAVSAGAYKPGRDLNGVNRALRLAERELLLPGGLPHRPWFRHAIYAPGRFTGYAATVLPGIGDALEAADPAEAQRQVTALADALNRAAEVLEKVR